MNLARWLLFCSAVAALSCTNTDAPPAETEVYVRVDTNVPGGPQSVLRGVRVYVSAPGEAPTSALSQDYQVPEGSGERNLFYVRVVPLRGDATRRVRFTVYGCSTVSCDPVSGAGTPITANSVTFGYLPNQTGWVRVFLADECRDVTCDETRETCNRDTGRCQPIPAVPTGCERLDDAGRAMDATCDVGALDAPPPMDVPVDLPSTEIDTDASCPGALLRCGDACVDVATDAAPDVADGSCAPGDGGCFSCPSTSAEIINRCTGASCARFDNGARLTRLLPDGGLPPLP